MVVRGTDSALSGVLGSVLFALITRLMPRCRRLGERDRPIPLPEGDAAVTSSAAPPRVAPAGRLERILAYKA
jgi:hypothetical protein